MQTPIVISAAKSDFLLALLLPWYCLVTGAVAEIHSSSGHLDKQGCPQLNGMFTYSQMQDLIQSMCTFAFEFSLQSSMESLLPPPSPPPSPSSPTPLPPQEIHKI